MNIILYLVQFSLLFLLKGGNSLAKILLIIGSSNILKCFYKFFIFVHIFCNILLSVVLIHYVATLFKTSSKLIIILYYKVYPN